MGAEEGGCSVEAAAEDGDVGGEVERGSWCIITLISTNNQLRLVLDREHLGDRWQQAVAQPRHLRDNTPRDVARRHGRHEGAHAHPHREGWRQAKVLNRKRERASERESKLNL